MDDDVTFMSDCLENLLLSESDIIVPLKKSKSGRIIDVTAIEADLGRLPFLDYKILRVDELNELEISQKVETFSFEGALFKADVFDKLGLPVSNYFIAHDDLEFSLRVKDYFRIELRSDAVCVREYLIDRKAGFYTWKSYFLIRNFFFVHRKYLSGVSGYLRPFFAALYFLIISLMRFKLINALRIMRGAFHGIVFNYRNFE
jgi:GT2 family glycosyltransferase